MPSIEYRVLYNGLIAGRDRAYGDIIPQQEFDQFGAGQHAVLAMIGQGLIERVTQYSGDGASSGLAEQVAHLQAQVDVLREAVEKLPDQLQAGIDSAVKRSGATPRRRGRPPKAAAPSAKQEG